MAVAHIYKKQQWRSAARRGLTTALLGMTALWGSACHPRKPLPRSHDGGPAVEMVEAKPANLGASSGNAAAPPQLPQALEHEPNDDPEHAQLLEVQTTVRGSLAPPTAMGAGKGDDDYYVYRSPATPQQIRVELTGSPAADLKLELWDGPESLPPEHQALIDEHGRGEGESLRNLVLSPNRTYYLRVRGTVTGSTQSPAEYEYQLSLIGSPAPPDSEQEPNDSPPLANPTLGGERSGALSFRKDEDYWVVSLPEALGRRPASSAAGTEGIRAPTVLRVELSTPGVVPSVRVFTQAAAPAPALPADAGPAPLTDGGAAPAPALALLAEVNANKGSQDLRLRNLSLPVGSARAYVAVRGLSFLRPPGETHYHLRLTVEPELEDAEVEPNDDCAAATPVKLASVGGGRNEGEIAGFLWPGDLDCFRLSAPAKGAQHWHLKLALPGGDCQATLDLVRGGDPPVKGTTDGAGGIELRATGDVVARVSSRDRKTCFEAPYRLTARTEPDAPGAKP